MAAPPPPLSVSPPLSQHQNSRINKDTITKAISSLLKWLPSNSKKQQQEPVTFIYLLLTLKNVPHKGRPLSFQIPLPNPFHTNPTLILSNNHPNNNLIPSNVTTVTLSSFTPTSSSLLFADHRIVKKLPKNHLPVIIPINLSRPSWADDLRKHSESTELKFRGGTCSGIRVGRATQTRDEIVENVVKAVEEVVKCVPKKWGNVRAFHVKAAESLALPIYQSEDCLKEEDVLKKRKLEDGKNEKRKKGKRS